MRELFKKSSFLFWQHPPLWIPVSVASVLEVFLGHAQQWLKLTLVSELAVRHSVLSSSASLSDIDYSSGTVAMIGVTVSAAYYFAVIFLYTSALIAVAQMLFCFAEERQPTWSSSLARIRASAPRIAVFSLVVLLFVALTLITDLGVLDFALLHLSRRTLSMLAPSYWGIAFGAVMFVALSSLLVPRALKLIGNRSVGDISKQCISQARIATAVTLIVSLALTILMSTFGTHKAAPIAFIQRQPGQSLKQS